MSVKRGQLIKIMLSKTRDQIIFNKKVLDKGLCGVTSLFFNKNFRLFSNVNCFISFLKNKKAYKTIIDSDHTMMKIQFKDQIWTNPLKFARERWEALYFVFRTTVTKVPHVSTKECLDGTYIKECLLPYPRADLSTAFSYRASAEPEPEFDFSYRASAEPEPEFDYDYCPFGDECPCLDKYPCPFGDECPYPNYPCPFVCPDVSEPIKNYPRPDVPNDYDYPDDVLDGKQIDESFCLETTHPFHILPSSPWPFFAAAGSLFLAIGAVLYMHSYFYGRILSLFGMITTITVMFNWWRDVIREGLYEKVHNSRVQIGLALGVILFIVSEAMLFFTFFWAFFYFSCVPTLDPEHSWPPKAIKEGSHLGMAAANTAILLATSFTITWSHNASIKGDKKFSVESLLITIGLSILFLSIQLYEFRSYSFSISDSVYGSCFYMITGFHGFHVIVGTIGLIIALIRAVNSNFTNINHLGVTAAIWYWHFVDVVWLFVFTTVYCWGNRSL